MDRLLSLALERFNSARRFLPMLCVLLVPLWVATGVQGAEESEKSAPQVKTAQGSLEGLRLGDSEVYRGIPYAKPPVGSLRWRPPQSVDAWSGVRPAKTFGPACPQPERFRYVIPDDQLPS